jgi:hypothetical protein
MDCERLIPLDPAQLVPNPKTHNGTRNLTQQETYFETYFDIRSCEVPAEYRFSGTRISEILCNYEYT